MPWFKVDDNLAFHAKVVAAGNAAMGLWVRAGSWSAQQLTDGKVPPHIVSALGGTRAHAKRLVEAGLWLLDDDGYRFHQWDERQPTREKVEAERAEAAERMRKAREAKRAGEVRSNMPRSSAGVRVTPTRPDPTRPGSWSDFEEEVEVELRESERHFDEHLSEQAAERRPTLRAVVADECSHNDPHPELCVLCERERRAAS